MPRYVALSYEFCHIYFEVWEKFAHVEQLKKRTIYGAPKAI